MNKGGIKILVLGILGLVVAVGIYVFVRVHTVPLYSCTVCLDKQCASSDSKHEFDTEAAKEARGNLCYQFYKDSLYECMRRPEKDFVYNYPPGKPEFYLNWFAGLTR